jgi:DEAD-like helicase
LKDIVHPKFKLIEFLSKGILYLHGRLPNNIRNYLLKCFRDDASIKHLIANSVILAGMNMPIDSLFFISGFSATNELINLVGRVNRLNEIFSNNGELNKILVPVHFVELDSYPQNRNGQLKKTVESLRSNIKDSVKNPLLENSVVNKSNLDNSEKILALESNIVNDFDNPSFISRLTRSGAQQLLNYTELGLIKLEKIIQETEIIHNADNVYKEILLKVKEVFFDNFVNEGADRAIDYRYFYPNNNVKRLRFEPTINYYSVFIPSSYSSLKDRVNNLVSYWEDILSSSSDHNKNFMQYVGSQFGEKAYQSDDYNDSRAKVYIDLNDYKTREYDMYNIAIIKLQTDDEFVDFEIGLLVNSLREFNIISDDLYNLFMFGTNDIKELQISQLGLSKNLYNTLKKDNQIQNIEFDDFHNPRANHHLREYILSKQGIEKFELEQYFL